MLSIYGHDRFGFVGVLCQHIKILQRVSTSKCQAFFPHLEYLVFWFLFVLFDDYHRVYGALSDKFQGMIPEFRLLFRFRYLPPSHLANSRIKLKILHNFNSFMPGKNDLFSKLFFATLKGSVTQC